MVEEVPIDGGRFPRPAAESGLAPRLAYDVAYAVNLVHPLARVGATLDFEANEKEDDSSGFKGVALQMTIQADALFQEVVAVALVLEGDGEEAFTIGTVEGCLGEVRGRTSKDGFEDGVALKRHGDVDIDEEISGRIGDRDVGDKGVKVVRKEHLLLRRIDM